MRDIHFTRPSCVSVEPDGKSLNLLFIIRSAGLAFGRQAGLRVCFVCVNWSGIIES
jgi:hypothetical protein